MRLPKWSWAFVVLVPLAAFSMLRHDVRPKHSAPSMPSVPGRDTFAEHFMQQIRVVLPKDHFRYVRDDFSVIGQRPDGTKWTSYLDNSYARVRARPQDERQILQEYTTSRAATLASPDPDESDRLAVLPVLKDERWMEASRQMLAKGEKPASPLADLLAPGLYVTYVIDGGKTMKFIHEDMPAKLGLDRVSLKAQALRNLALQLPQLRFEPDHGLYRLRLDGNYETSMPLLYDRWRERLNLRHDPVFALPARGEALLADSQDAAAVARLREIARADTASSSYAVSGHVFILHDGVWQSLP